MSKSTPVGIKSILEKLSKLTDAPPSEDQRKEAHKQIATEKNDRGAAILLASTVQITLQAALLGYLGLDRAPNELFGHEGSPMGTFENQIRMAYALRIIGDETRTNLKLIKGIRNTFAHTLQPLTFETEEIVVACSRLSSPLQKMAETGAGEGFGAKYAINGPPARRQFQIVANAIAFALSIQGARMMRPIPAKNLIPNFPPHEGYTVSVMPPPLP